MDEEQQGPPAPFVRPDSHQNFMSGDPETNKVKVITFIAGNGRITGLTDCEAQSAPLQARPQWGQAQIYVDEFPPEGIEHYILNGKPVPRPPCPAVLNGTTLSGIPIPSAVWVAGRAYDCQDGIVNLSFGKPGLYKVTVESWPFLRGDYEVAV